MAKETIRLRDVRLDDWTAETLEAEAKKMPLSCRKQADGLRRQAEILRGSRDKRMITVRERIVSDYVSE
jgi:hypothetical protein